MQTVASTLGLTVRRLSGLSAMRKSQPGPIPVAPAVMPAIDSAALQHRITLEIEDESAEEAEAVLVTRAGNEWARDGAWDHLADTVQSAERSRARTKGGVRHRALLLSGALLTVDTAIGQGDTAAAQSALAAFTDARDAAPNCPVRAALAARANVGLAWFVRGDRSAEEVSPADWTAIQEQVTRAQAILAPFEGRGGTILGEARYRAAILGGDVQTALPQLYDAWAAADPEDAAPMEMHGFYMLPRWGGSLQEVELQARRAALRTDDSIGFSGYAMLALPLLEHEPALLTQLDPALFVEGLDDWLTTYPEPGRVNAFLRETVEILNAAYPGLEDRPELAAFRAHVSQSVAGLIGRHLRLVVPRAWNDDLDWLRSVLARAYHDHLQSGGTLHVGAKGITLGQVAV